MRARASSPAHRTARVAEAKPAAAVAPTAPAATAAANAFWFWWRPDGLGGVSNKGIFGTGPPWVDETKLAGYTSLGVELSLKTQLRKVVTGRHFLMSPNSSWFAIAFAMYLFCPYDLASAKAGWATDWVAKRFALNFSVALAYYSVFYFGLFHFGWGARKYNLGVYPTAGNMAHNLWYWFLGVVQWTLWECVMIRLWATGVVPYTSDAQLLANWKLLAFNGLLVLLTPVWRELHFYIAHRFIHIRAIYKYVHSLHHRNADPEPFCGLCMHPVEHLYYFSNAWTPALYLTLSPFVSLFTFVHLAIAPGASHSGWEDHFQSDQYHYLHHAKFECNYGSSLSACIDQALGTFREALGDSARYEGEWSEKTVKTQEIAESTPGKKGVWSERGCLGLPASKGDAIYTLFWVALWLLAIWGAAANHGAGRVVMVAGLPASTFIAGMVAYSPVVFALLLARSSGDRMSWRWPFHKERLMGTFGVFLGLGWLACCLPVYHATKWICDA